MLSVRNTVSEVTRDHEFQNRVLKLAVPMVVSSILSSSLQIVDTLMIAAMGDVAVAAVGLANRLSYILSIVTAGVASGASVFAAQYWGDRSQKGLGRTMGLALLLMMAVNLLFTLIAVLAPRWVMRIFSSEEVVIADGCAYLRWMGLAYAFQGLTALLAAMMKATEKPKPPVIAATVGMVSNVILNYLLIFGKLGLPAMGVKGAAIATLISAVIEAAMMVFFAGRSEAPLTAVQKPSFVFAGQFLKVAVPVMFNSMGWALGTVMMTWVYATMGTAATAAASVYETVKGFVVVLCVSLGTAGGILLGIELGAGRREAAEKMARQILTVNAMLALLVTPLMLIGIRPLMLLYSEMSEQALHNLSGMLTALALCFIIKSFCFTFINGILRAGGDTKAAAAIDVGCLWGIAVPLVFLTGYVFKWNIVYVFPFTFAEESVVALLAYRRYKKGYWLKKLG